MDPEGTPTAIDERLLGGLTLIDRGEFYEAHELLEDLWAGEVGAERHALQALIQLTVALHHRQNRNVGGARALLLRAVEHCAAAGTAAISVDARALGRVCVRLLDEAQRTERELAQASGGLAPPLDATLLPSFGEQRAAIRAERGRRGLEPDPPIEFPPA